MSSYALERQTPTQCDVGEECQLNGLEIKMGKELQLRVAEGHLKKELQMHMHTDHNMNTPICQTIYSRKDKIKTRRILRQHFDDRSEDTHKRHPRHIGTSTYAIAS